MTKFEFCRIGAAVALLPFFFSGCAILAPTGPDNVSVIAPGKYDEAAQSVVDWSLQGRVVVRNETQGWHATLNWTQARDDYHIDLSGPLGQGAVALDGDSENMRAQLSGEDVPREGPPSQLLSEVVGWQVPVLSLRYWVLGLPDPSEHTSDRQWDAVGRPATLSQSGWTIEYSRYREDGLLPLPTRLRAARGEWSFKLVVDTWTFEQTEAIKRALRSPEKAKTSVGSEVGAGL